MTKFQEFLAKNNKFYYSDTDLEITIQSKTVSTDGSLFEKSEKICFDVLHISTKECCQYCCDVQTFMRQHKGNIRLAAQYYASKYVEECKYQQSKKFS